MFAHNNSSRHNASSHNREEEGGGGAYSSVKNAIQMSSIDPLEHTAAKQQRRRVSDTHSPQVGNVKVYGGVSG